MKGHVALLIGLLLLPAAPAAGGRDIAVDALASQVGFDLRTRWGQRLEGRFPAFAGVVLVLPQGERQVQLTLDARAVEIVGHPRYTRLTREEGFFDAQRHPGVRFVSEAFPAQLMREGGELAGVLDLRGVQRREQFVIAAADCERPLLDCAVQVSGEISRRDYAMDRWAFALSDRVRFSLLLRGREAAAP